MEHKSAPSILNIPTAIVIAGAIIAGAVIYTMKPAAAPAAPQVPGTVQANLKPVSADDHILGNPAAPIKIVEYSDTSCPYCKMFYSTLLEIMNVYGKSGQVAWVYRHYPLDKPDSTGAILHPNAGHEAEALECAASLGGNDKFWAYTDELYSITPSVTPDTPNGLDQSKLPQIAKDVGLNVNDFNTCLNSGKFKDKIDQEFTDGVNVGITGTPTSFLITPSGQVITLEGAESYDTLKQSIDALLADQNSNTSEIDTTGSSLDTTNTP